MLRFLFILIILLTLQKGHCQQLVRDRYKQRQLESMVVTRWGKFIPKWYYFLFHNKYRKGEDRRTMLQLLPTIASVSITEDQSKQEKEDTQALFDQSIYVNTNRILQPVYFLQFKPKFQQLNTDISQKIEKVTMQGADQTALIAFKEEQERLNDQIEILRKGFLDQGESAEGYAEIEAELRKLKGMIMRYSNHQDILNKFSQL